MFSISTVASSTRMPDGEREAAEGHDIDGFAESAEEKNADENRKRNRN